MSRYKSEDEILAVVRSFENATIGRDEWKHAEHLLVALHYVEAFGLEAATNKMRSGIRNLLTNGFNVDLEKEMPYHETITVFWMRTAYAFLLMTPSLSSLERTNALVAGFDKEFPLRFYSRDLLFSEEARAAYVGPDLIQAGSLEEEIHRSMAPTV
ncbi:MAG: hypothetical protein QUS14_11385 [Pyrinomonadaceae bacterium]|nr:hypothetical protein [Pyrinomonadaceae bacterium]